MVGVEKIDSMEGLLQQGLSNVKVTLESTIFDRVVTSQLATIEEMKIQEQAPLDHIRVEEVVALVLEDCLVDEGRIINGGEVEDGEIQTKEVLEDCSISSTNSKESNSYATQDCIILGKDTHVKNKPLTEVLPIDGN